MTGDDVGLDRDVLDLVELAEGQGWTVTTTSGQHTKFVSPGGELVYGHGTASDWRSILDLRARLRRAGLGLDPDTTTTRTKVRRPPEIPKLIVAERETVDPGVLAQGIHGVLGDGPLSEGMLVFALRQAGHRVIASDLGVPLGILMRKGAIEMVGETYARVPLGNVTRTRPRRRQLAGTKHDVWCAPRKGAWHCTQHNNRPSGPFRSLCGYQIEGVEEFEQRRPNCPYCLEKLERMVFL
jgi:hypothetical protein